MKGPIKTLGEDKPGNIAATEAAGYVGVGAAAAAINHAVEPFLSRFQALLADIHGMPARAWLRMAQDEFARTNDVVWAHIARSVCATSGMSEPPWVHPALLTQSHTITEALLKHGLDRAPPRSTPQQRAIRDFRLTREVVRLKQTKKISTKKAFKEAAKLLPARRGEPRSMETTKRAFRRFASDAAFKRIYRGE